MMEWFKKLSFKRKLTSTEKFRYRWVLKNIYSCKTYDELLTCEMWILRAVGFTPYTKHKLLNKTYRAMSIMRKRGMAKCVSRKNG